MSIRRKAPRREPCPSVGMDSSRESRWSKCLSARQACPSPVNGTCSKIPRKLNFTAGQESGLNQLLIGLELISSLQPDT